jgi:signal recognition particle receptor subunit beta
VPAQRRRAGTALKIVVTGPYGAGKTTLIRTVSEITVLSTERPIGGEAAEALTDAGVTPAKGHTTVAMDFGRIRIDHELVLYLFGTPGQDRFDFMWDVLGRGMLGYVVVLDGTAADPAGDARAVREAFRRMAPGLGFVVAVNRSGPLDEAVCRDLRHRLDLPVAVPVLGFDATDRESVKAVLLALLNELLATCDRTTAV